MLSYKKAIASWLSLCLLAHSFPPPLTAAAPSPLDNLPRYGVGLLASLKNNTDFYAGIELNPSLYDNLSNNTVIVLQPNSPEAVDAASYTGDKSDLSKLYYTLQTNPDTPSGYVLRVTNNKNQATNFTVKRYLDGSLTDWIGLVPAGFNGQMLCANDDGSVTLADGSKVFDDEDGKAFHWGLVGDSFSSIKLQNRKTTGCMYADTSVQAVTTAQGQTETVIANSIWTIQGPKAGKKEVYGQQVIIKSLDTGNFITAVRKGIQDGWQTPGYEFTTGDRTGATAFEVLDAKDRDNGTSISDLKRLSAGSVWYNNTHALKIANDDYIISTQTPCDIGKEDAGRLFSNNNKLGDQERLYIRTDKEPYQQDQPIYVGDTVSIWATNRFCWQEKTPGTINLQAPTKRISRASWHQRGMDAFGQNTSRSFNITRLLNLSLDVYLEAIIRRFGITDDSSNYLNAPNVGPGHGGKRGTLGDPAPGDTKDWWIEIMWDGTKSFRSGDENDWGTIVELPGAPGNHHRDPNWWFYGYEMWDAALMAKKQPVLSSQHCAQPSLFQLIDANDQPGSLSVGELFRRNVDPNNSSDVGQWQNISSGQSVQRFRMVSVVSDTLGWAIDESGALIEFCIREPRADDTSYLARTADGKILEANVAATGFTNKRTLWVSANGNVVNQTDPSIPGSSPRPVLKSPGGVWCIVEEQDNPIVMTQEIVHAGKRIAPRPIRYGRIYQRLGDLANGYTWSPLNMEDLGGDEEVAPAPAATQITQSTPSIDLSSAATAGMSDADKAQLAATQAAVNKSLADVNKKQQQQTAALTTSQKFTGFIRLAVCNDNNVWAIDNKFKIRHLDGTGATLDSGRFLKDAVDIAIESTGQQVWAVSSEGTVWRYNTNLKAWGLIPTTTKYFFRQVAVRNAKEVWGIADDPDSGQTVLLRYDGKDWTRSNVAPDDGKTSWRGQQSGDMPSFVSVASGTTTRPVAGAAGQTQSTSRSVESIRTTITVDQDVPDPSDPTKQKTMKVKAIQGYSGPKAAMRMTIMQQGMGGSIPPNGAANFGPMQISTTRPHIYGFAKDTLGDKGVNQGTLIGIGRLMSKGAAWFDATMATPNRGAISFQAKTVKGNAQILLGDQQNEQFIYRIRIGVDNTFAPSADIYKCTYDPVTFAPTPVQVFQVTFKQNPLAAAQDGRWAPYWVSYDNGLILVGAGEVGKNVFMAWRDPEPHTQTDIRFIGLGSDDQPVGYTQCSQTAPVVATPPVRIYRSDATAIRLNSTPQAHKLPLRASGRGSVGFKVNGTTSPIILLGSDKTFTKACYRISFGAIKPIYAPEDLDATGKPKQGTTASGVQIGISIERKEAAGDFIEQGFITTVQASQATGTKTGLHPYAEVDPSQPNDLWVSYNNGVLALGRGVLSPQSAGDLFYAWTDLNPLPSIRYVGFASGKGFFGGDTGGTVQNVSIAQPLELEVEGQAASYDRIISLDSYLTGGMTIILPFDYKLDQIKDTPSVTCMDTITKQFFYSAGVPQRGGQYHFMAVIDASGGINLTPQKAVSNPTQQAVARKIFTMQADATKARQQGTELAAEGMNAQQLAQNMTSVYQIQAQSQTDLKNAEANVSGAAGQALQTSAGGAAQAFGFLGQGPTPIHIGVGAAGVVAMSGIALSSIALIQQAAQIQQQGAQQAAKTIAQATQGLSTAAATQKAKQDQQIKVQQEADNLEYQAKLLQGESDLAFQSGDSYVYTDKGIRDQLGSISVPPQVTTNRQIAVSKIEEAGKYFNLIDNTSLMSMNNALADALSVANNFYVLNGADGGDTYTRTKLLDGLDNLYNTYTQIYTTDQTHFNPILHNNLIKLFIRAYNNAYLTNQSDDQQAIRRTWYFRFNALARELLNPKQLDPNYQQPDDPSLIKMSTISLPPCYGEYVWLPIQLGTADLCSVTFQANGHNDIMIGLAKEAAPTRNTDNELYEISFAASKRTAHIIRIKSLDKPVGGKKYLAQAAYMPKEQTGEYTPYWIVLKKGVITIGSGTTPSKETTIAAWKDPYPTSGIKYVGISCWNSPITLKNIVVRSPVAKASTPTAPQKQAAASSAATSTKAPVPAAKTPDPAAPATTKAK